MRKVAIVGSGKITNKEAPFDDPSFEIWGLSRNYQWMPRIDRYFELHNIDLVIRPQEYAQSWLEALRKMGSRLYIQKPTVDLRQAQTFPLEELLNRFGRNFRSTVSYLIAYAIILEVSEIAFYGIHMDTEEEYTIQRENAEFYVRLAEYLGIKITCPNGTAFMKREAPLYGYEHDTAYYFVRSKIDYMQQKAELHRNKIEKEKQQLWHSQGCLEALKHINDSILY